MTREPWFAALPARLVWLVLYPWNRWQGDSHADLMTAWRLT